MAYSGPDNAPDLMMEGERLVRQVYSEEETSGRPQCTQVLSLISKLYMTVATSITTNVHDIRVTCSTEDHVSGHS